MRREHDSLGDKDVPSEALYGIQTQRAIENFPISGLPPRAEFVEAIVLVKKAAAQVNGELGLLAGRQGRRDRARRRRDPGRRPPRRVPGRPVPGRRRHVAQHERQRSARQSRQRAARRRAARSVCAGAPQRRRQPGPVVQRRRPDGHPPRLAATGRRALAPRCRACSEALEAKGAEFDHILKSARTHLQDAVPIRLGQEFAAYAVTVRKARDRVAEALAQTRALHIGGTAAGTGLNTDPRYAGLMVARLSELAGRPLRAADDLVQATQSLDDFVAFSGALRGAALSLIQIANDLRLLSSGPRTGIAEITSAGRAAGLFDHAGQGQPGDGGDARHGLLSRGRRRRRRGARRPGRAVRDQRHDAARGLRAAVLVAGAGRRRARLCRTLRPRHRGRRGATAAAGASAASVWRPP